MGEQIIMQYMMFYHSPVGILTLTSDGDSLTGVWFEGQASYDAMISYLGCDISDLRFAAGKTAAAAFFAKVCGWLDRYFAGEKPDPFEIPVKVRGTDFRLAVWSELRKLPYGKTISYGDIAKAVAERLGKIRMSAQAVGGAVGHNPVSIIIPCHRVIGADGSMTGFGGGVDKKIWLLKHEGAIIDPRLK